MNPVGWLVGGIFNRHADCTEESRYGAPGLGRGLSEPYSPSSELQDMETCTNIAAFNVKQLSAAVAVEPSGTKNRLVDH